MTKPSELHLLYSPAGLEARSEINILDQKNAGLGEVDAFEVEWAELRVNQLWARTWARNVLSKQQLSLLTIGILAGSNRMEEMRAHIRIALTVTMVPLEQMREALLHVALYCGIPTGREAFIAAGEVIRDAGIDTSVLVEKTSLDPEPTDSSTVLSDDALETRRRILGEAVHQRLLTDVDGFNREWVNYITNQIIGRTWASEHIPVGRTRLMTIGLMAGGRMWEEFKRHSRNALRNEEIAVAELREALIHISMYAGAGTAQEAFVIARQLVKEEGIDLSVLEES